MATFVNCIYTAKSYTPLWRGDIQRIVVLTRAAHEPAHNNTFSLSQKKRSGTPLFYSVILQYNVVSKPSVIHWYYVKSVNVFTGLLLSLKV